MMLFELLAQAASVAEVSTITTIGEISKAFLTPIIAIIAVTIGWSQYEAARYKIRLDLFDRRYEIYNAIHDLYQQVKSGSKYVKATNEQTHYILQKAKFLVDKNLVELINEFYMQSHTDLNVVYDWDFEDESVEEKVERERRAEREKEMKIERYFKVFHLIEQKFEKYLNFSDNFKSSLDLED